MLVYASFIYACAQYVHDVLEFVLDGLPFHEHHLCILVSSCVSMFVASWKLMRNIWKFSCRIGQSVLVECSTKNPNENLIPSMLECAQLCKGVLVTW